MAGRSFDDRDAYLARLGVDPEPPSVDALFRLHRAHVERVPWETLWIQVGDLWGIELDTSATRVATTTRGGYCFHLNGAFSVLLESFGYSVARHLGGVHGPDGPAPTDMSNHLVLTVEGLPSDANPGGAWYLDVGLGDALYEPMALTAGTGHHAPFDLAVEPAGGTVGDWHLTHGQGGSFAGMSWRSSRVEMSEFEERHRMLSTSPESGFVRTLVVQRHDATGIDVLRGVTLRRLGEGATERTLTTPVELFDAIGDVFGIDVSPFDQWSRTALWDRVQAAEAQR